MPHPNTGPGGRSTDGPLWSSGEEIPTVYDVANALSEGHDPESVALAVAEASSRAGYPITNDDVVALADSFRLLRRLPHADPE